MSTKTTASAESQLGPGDIFSETIFTIMLVSIAIAVLWYICSVSYSLGQRSNAPEIQSTRMQKTGEFSLTAEPRFEKTH